MSKIQIWNPEEAKKELSKRLRNAQYARRFFEMDWKNNEKTIYSTGFNTRNQFKQGLWNTIDEASPSGSSADVNIAYAFKNIRFIHAQLSANPPVTTARPTSSDPSDRQKADAADRLIRYALRHYILQEYVDKASLNCLVYGTGVLKTIHDPYKGQIMDVTEEGEVTTEGDISFSVPSTWDIFIDPDADSIDQVRYIFERIQMPYEEALFRWPDKPDLIKKLRKEVTTNTSLDSAYQSQLPFLTKDKYDIVEVYEYWERGLPTNAYLGRYGICAPDGALLEGLKPSPFRFKPTTDNKAKYEIADLPYHIFTDIDVPSQVLGKSVLDYVTPIQDTLNRLDTVNLDNIQAHGVTRIVLPDGAEVADDSITNSPYDIIRITGNQGPHYMSPPTSMPQIDNFRAQIKMGIDDMCGINDAMLGQQKRETSGLSMQLATNQGNMIRRRLFNKYALFVESIYRGYLNLVRKHWESGRIIYVLGKEKALEAVEIKGADITGGYDLIVEYGTSLSLDPITRRDELLTLQPLFEKAGVPPRIALKMMKLNELEGLYDMMQLAEDRQREIFEEMIATRQLVQPEQYQDHENMLAYCMQYVMTTEYKYLDDDSKALIIEHIQLRSQVAAQEKAGGQPGASSVPGALPGGPMPPGPQPATPAPPAQELAPAGVQSAPPPPINQ